MELVLVLQVLANGSNVLVLVSIEAVGNLIFGLLH